MVGSLDCADQLTAAYDCLLPEVSCIQLQLSPFLHRRCAQRRGASGAALVS
jgi:hypothetical protein